MSQLETRGLKRLTDSMEKLVAVLRDAELMGNADKNKITRTLIWKQIREIKENWFSIGLFVVFIFIVLGFLPIGTEEMDLIAPFAELPFYHSLLLLVLIGYLLMRRILLQVKVEKTNPDSEYFHFDTYKEERKMEFSALYPLVKEPDILASIQSDYQLLHRENRELRDALIDLEKNYLKAEVSAEKDLNESRELFRNVENSYENLFKFLKNINTSFFTLIKDEQSFHAIHLNFDYVLYREDGEFLRYVANGGGNHTSFVSAIPLTQSQNSFVRAFHEEAAVIDEERMIWKVKFHQDTTWVLCIYTKDNWISDLLKQRDHAKLEIQIIQDMFQIIVELNHNLSKLRSDENGNHE